jgi:Flp pilus assembly protein TadB
MTTPLPADKPKNSLRAILIFYIAMIIGCISFAVITVAVTAIRGGIAVVDKQYGSILLGIAAIAAAICLFVARQNYNKAITNAKDSLIPLPDKLNIYRGTLIKYMALCDFPALFSIILFFISGNYLLLLVTGVMLIAMLVKFPTVTRVVAELELGSQEQQELE